MARAASTRFQSIVGWIYRVPYSTVCARRGCFAAGDCGSLRRLQEFKAIPGNRPSGPADFILMGEFRHDASENGENHFRCDESEGAERIARARSAKRAYSAL